MMNRSLGTALALVMLLALGACAKQGAPGADSAYTGTLVQSAAIGGETTGWALGDSAGNVLMQLDLSNVRGQADDLDGKRVRVSGQVEMRQYTESGEQPVLVVNRIEAAR